MSQVMSRYPQKSAQKPFQNAFENVREGASEFIAKRPCITGHSSIFYTLTRARLAGIAVLLLYGLGLEVAGQSGVEHEGELVGAHAGAVAGIGEVVDAADEQRNEVGQGGSSEQVRKGQCRASQ